MTSDVDLLPSEEFSKILPLSDLAGFFAVTGSLLGFGSCVNGTVFSVLEPDVVSDPTVGPGFWESGGVSGNSKSEGGVLLLPFVTLFDHSVGNAVQADGPTATEPNRGFADGNFDGF